MNVALRGMMAEMSKERPEIRGSVRTRRQAQVVAEIAKRDVEEMERGAERTWNVRSRAN